jgi:DMSO/TMAO reductase YedYZ molybdopterin-dependent catalytic subunit
VALGEVWPNASNKDVLVAYQQDGEDIRNGVRLVVTGDGLAGRSIGGVVSIDAATVKADPAPAGTLELIGEVDRPGPVDLSSLPADAYTEVTTVAAVGHAGTAIDPRTYGGYRLYSILEHAGIQIDERQHEDFVGKVVVASSTDGHSVVIAGGEIEPRFMNGDAIIATTRDGKPLEDEGGVRLMVPYDKKPGRWAKFITRLELRRA